MTAPSLDQSSSLLDATEIAPELSGGLTARQLSAAPACPLCAGSAPQILFRLRNSPFVQNRLLVSREEALASSRVDVVYHYCDDCRFAFNPSFDRRSVDYDGYYNKQTASTTYRDHVDSLARRLAADCELGPDSRIVEIGCGNGDFLSRLGAVTGSSNLRGYDPAYRGENGLAEHVERRFFTTQDHGVRADLIVFRHCLEGLLDVQATMDFLRHASAETRLYAEITDLDHILGERNPSLLYHECYRYFSLRAIDSFLRRVGFRPQRVYSLLGGGTLGITAVRGPEISPLGARPAHDAIRPAWRAVLDDPYERLEEVVRRHDKVVMWGISGRAISVLNHMSWNERVVAFGVDIDPARQGMFVPVTGQRVLSPAQARLFAPDLVIVANELYAREIREAIGPGARLVTLQGRYV
jgi:hypothetical protein